MESAADSSGYQDDKQDVSITRHEQCQIHDHLVIRHLLTQNFHYSELDRFLLISHFLDRGLNRGILTDDVS